MMMNASCVTLLLVCVLSLQWAHVHCRTTPSTNGTSRNTASTGTSGRSNSGNGLEGLEENGTIQPIAVNADYPDTAGANEENVGSAGGKPDLGEHGCVCVPYYQCSNGQIVTDGSGIIDPRKRKPEGEAEVPLNGRLQAPYCGQFHVCCSDPQTVTAQPFVHKCGVRNPNGLDAGRTAHARTLSDGNGESQFGEWPWQAAILKSDANGQNLFQCGGVLVDKQHVVTVAHCIAGKDVSADQVNSGDWRVRLGEWDTQNTEESLPHEDFFVEQVHLHPEYRSNNLYNDIALLRLSRPVSFKPHIDSICLPRPNDDYVGQQCVTTGWGKNAYRGGTYSNILKEVSVPVISHEQCQTSLRTTRLGQRFRLHQSFMCAGGEQGRDSCKGDGGGPLVCYRQDGTYALAGIVAWGIDCGQPGVPGVYVNVADYVEWVAQVTGKQPNNFY